MTRSGFFITLEGPEGSGKSTQQKMLAEELLLEGHEVVTTCEPGGDPVALQIREILLHTQAPLAEQAELLLYLAARAQHIRQVVEPALESGKIVICDRFSDSTLAYQGYGRGLDIEKIRIMNDFATGGIKPDLTVLLDVPTEVGLLRQVHKDRMGAESVRFHEKVRQGFLEIADEEPERFVVIDATDDLDAVHRRLVEVVKSRLPSGV